MASSPGWACAGKSSKEYERALGYPGCEEVIHRDNICRLMAPRNVSKGKESEWERDSGSEVEGGEPATPAMAHA